MRIAAGVSNCWALGMRRGMTSAATSAATAITAGGTRSGGRFPVTRENSTMSSSKLRNAEPKMYFCPGRPLAMARRCPSTMSRAATKVKPPGA